MTRPIVGPTLESIDCRLGFVETQVMNHLPSRLRWINTKINFLLAFLGLVIALNGVVIMLALR